MFAKNALRWALSLSAGLFWFAGCASEKAPSDLEQTPRIEPSAASSARNADALKSSADEEASAAEEVGGVSEPPVLVTSPPAVYTKENGDMIGVTRQGNEYVINPLWYGKLPPDVDSASWRAAATEPTGPPLTIDWAPVWAISAADWRDPRSWESYRNFWGFDKITTDENGQYPYRAVIDNWGDRIMWRKNTRVVRHYGRRVGFRPSPEQLERYLSLDAEYKQALGDGDASKCAALRKEMSELRAFAQGQLPTFAGGHLTGYGKKPTPEESRAQQQAAFRDVYRRMGIEHLYEFYEVNYSVLK